MCVCVFRRLRRESRLQGVGETVRMAQNQVHAAFPFMRSSQANKERMRLRDENYTEPALRTHGIYIHTHTHTHSS